LCDALAAFDVFCGDTTLAAPAPVLNPLEGVVTAELVAALDVGGAEDGAACADASSGS
jgi:hypothetical protein